MALAKDHDVIKAFASDRPDQAFTMSILPRRAWGGWLVSNAHGAETSFEDVARGLSLPQIQSDWNEMPNWTMLRPMVELFKLLCSAVIGLFRSRASLEAENVALRHQLNVLRRQSPKRPTLSTIDRLIFVGLYRFAPNVRETLRIVDPETVIRWHRAGIRLFWRWKSRSRPGRPKVASEISPINPRDELGQPAMGRSTHSWRTAQARDRRWSNLGRQIHGEVQKTTVSRVEDVPAQPRRWDRGDGPVRRADPIISGALRLADHATESAADVVAGRDGHPTAGWIARQLTEACGWEQGPDISSVIETASMAKSSSGVFVRWAFAINRPRRGRPGRTGIVKDSIGSIRRECLDHVVVLGERHLCHVLHSYLEYDNGARTHLALSKDAPIPRAIKPVGANSSAPILGGLHHLWG